MKNILLFILFFFPFFVFSQSFSNYDSYNNIKSNKNFNFVNDTSFLITHSASQDIMPGTAVSCNLNGVHYENSYYRVFDLFGNLFNMNSDWSVQEVQVGIGFSEGGINSQQNIKLILYVMSQYDGNSIPLDSLSQKGDTLTFQVSDNESGTIKKLNLPSSISIPYGSVLVVEILVPDGQEDNNTFFIGSNNLSQTDNTYIKAPHCGVNEPVNVTDIGYPDMHLLLNVVGAYDAANPQIVSFQIEGQLTETEINNNPNTIKLILPADTSLTHLSPKIVVPIGFYVSPASDEFVDFSQGDVQYTVTNEQNKISETWLVSVQNAKADIVDVQIDNQLLATDIDLTNHIATVYMPNGTDLTAISPNITVYEGFNINPASGVEQDFSLGAVQYTVSHNSLPLSQEWFINLINETSYKENKDVKLYPNPAKDFIYFQNSEISLIEVFNISGELIILSKNNKLDVRRLKRGIYFSKIYLKNTVKTLKFIKY